MLGRSVRCGINHIAIMDGKYVQFTHKIATIMRGWTLLILWFNFSLCLCESTPFINKLDSTPAQVWHASCTSPSTSVGILDRVVFISSIKSAAKDKFNNTNLPQYH